MGILMARIANRWQFNKQPPKMKVSPLGFGGHLFYLLSMILCLYMICVFGVAWLARPEEWMEPLMGILFFGAGAVALLVFWGADSHFISNWLTEAGTNVVLGICSFVLALGAGYVIALGNMFWGIAGVVFFGWGGVVLLRKGTNKGGR